MLTRRRGTFFGAIFIAALSLQACKTAGKKKDDGSSTKVVGFLDDKGRMRVRVPGEINGLTPSKETKTQASIVPKISGLSLDGSSKPETSKGVEEIMIKCFTQDSLFIAKGWYFYAELQSNGSVIKTYNNQKVDRCNEMQLELKTLDKNTTYVVKASFFWQDESGQTTIVWYEGETEPFKPGDRDRQLVLEKLRVNQTLDVDVAKSEKDECIFRKFLWNGTRCLDGYNAISFNHTDFTDYASAPDIAGSRKRKCLQVGADQKAIQYECKYDAKQRVRTVLHGVQELEKLLPPTEYGWFTIQFDAGKLCLTAKKDPAGGNPYLTQAACSEAVPPAEQLFTLIATLEGDSGGRDSFRIMNQFDKQARCLSVPPEQGDSTGVAPLRDGAPVKLSLCDDFNEYTKRSQYVRFVAATD